MDDAVTTVEGAGERRGPPGAANRAGASMAIRYLSAAVATVVAVGVGLGTTLVETQRVVALLVGLRLLVGAWRRHRSPRAEGKAVAVCLVGALILMVAAVRPVADAPTVGRGIGLALVVLAVVIRYVSDPQPTDAALATLLITMGAALVVAPTFAVTFAIVLIVGLVVVWLLVCAAEAAGLIDLGRRGGDRPHLVETLRRWISRNGRITDDRESLVDSLFYEGRTANREMFQYGTLMLLASGIAAMGVLVDSTAVVIGAMLVAPLITPMLGMAMSLAMGWPARLVRSTAMVVLGVVLSIATSALLAAVVGLTVDVTSNSQITSRATPTVADLVIALIAGAAGAYAHVRRDVSSSLPGVAIAVALVPPLAVVGVAAQQGDWEQAFGTLLLFLTNLVGILVAGGAVFVATGVVTIGTVRIRRQRVRTALMSVTVLALLVIGALSFNGNRVATDSINNDRVRAAVADWLGEDTEFSIISVTTTDDESRIVLAGPGSPPDIERLRSLMAERVDGVEHLDVQWVERRRSQVDVGPT